LEPKPRPSNRRETEGDHNNPEIECREKNISSRKRVGEKGAYRRTLKEDEGGRDLRLLDIEGKK